MSTCSLDLEEGLLNEQTQNHLNEVNVGSHSNCNGHSSYDVDNTDRESLCRYFETSTSKYVTNSDRINEENAKNIGMEVEMEMYPLKMVPRRTSMIRDCRSGDAPRNASDDELLDPSEGSKDCLEEVVVHKDIHLFRPKSPLRERDGNKIDDVSYKHSHQELSADDETQRINKFSTYNCVRNFCDGSALTGGVRTDCYRPNCEIRNGSTERRKEEEWRELDNRKDGEQVNSESRISSDDTTSDSKTIAERNHLDSSSLTRPSNVLYLNDNYFFRPNYIREWGDPPSRDKAEVTRRTLRRDSKKKRQNGNSSTTLAESIDNYQGFQEIDNLISFIDGNTKKASEKPVEKIVAAQSGAKNKKNKKKKSKKTEKNEGEKECDDATSTSTSEKGQDINYEQTIEKLVRDLVVPSVPVIEKPRAVLPPPNIGNSMQQKTSRHDSFKEETYSSPDMDAREEFQTVASKKKKNKQAPKTDSRTCDSFRQNQPSIARNIAHANQNTARSNPAQNSWKPQQPSMRNKKNEAAGAKNTNSFNSDESRILNTANFPDLLTMTELVRRNSTGNTPQAASENCNNTSPAKSIKEPITSYASVTAKSHSSPGDRERRRSLESFELQPSAVHDEGLTNEHLGAAPDEFAAGTKFRPTEATAVEHPQRGCDSVESVPRDSGRTVPDSRNTGRVQTKFAVGGSSQIETASDALRKKDSNPKNDRSPHRSSNAGEKPPVEFLDGKSKKLKNEPGLQFGSQQNACEKCGKPTVSPLCKDCATSLKPEQTSLSGGDISGLRNDSPAPLSSNPPSSSLQGPSPSGSSSSGRTKPHATISPLQKIEPPVSGSDPIKDSSTAELSKNANPQNLIINNEAISTTPVVPSVVYPRVDTSGPVRFLYEEWKRVLALERDEPHRVTRYVA